MADTIVEELFDDAYRLNEELQEMYEKRNGIRSSLRNLRDAGKLSEEQEAELKELYPDVKRRRKEETTESES